MKAFTFARAHKAFTLIELLVVIAIIAILAAILFPVFASAREKARQATCSSNMKQMGMGILQYVQDYDERFPYLGNVSNLYGGAPNCNWLLEIYPYVNSTAVFMCPDDSKANLNSWQGYGVSYSANGLIQYGWAPSYGTAWEVGVMNYIRNGTKQVNSGTEGGIVQSQIQAPDSIIMVAEAWNSDYLNPAVNGGNGNFTGTLMLSQFTDQYPGAAIPTASRALKSWPPVAGWGGNGGVSAHHGETGANKDDGMSNFLFADGHVKAMKPYLTNPNSTANNMWVALK